GGGDERFGLGTVARIVQAAQTEDGRWGLLTVGARRIKVEEWLPEDPYPKAAVVDLPSDKVDETHAEGLQRVERAVRRALAPPARSPQGCRRQMTEPQDAARESIGLRSLRPHGRGYRKCQRRRPARRPSWRTVPP